MYLTKDVFGITRELPLNYVERELVDKKLRNNLKRGKHLVIYGSSKQGKTSLRKHVLKEGESIVVHCSNKWSISDINTAILKSAGYEINLSETKTVGGKSKILAKIASTFMGVIKAEGVLEAERDHSEEIKRAPLELDPEDVNDIISALNSIEFNKYVVLEDFHYLDKETQKDFSVALKAYHEESKICFIIIGVWLEENRLTVYNGDLVGRVYSIDADKWNEEELREVVRKGEELLNIKLSESFLSTVIKRCLGNVYLLQEACYRCCEKYGIEETQKERISVGQEMDSDLISVVIDEQSGRYNSFITQFSDGFQATELEMYKWILYPVLTADTDSLISGLTYNEITKCLREHHPQKEKLNLGNITQSLQYCAALQVKKAIKPIILDYDETNLRLRVVDSGFLIWLNLKNRNNLLDLAGLPSD